MSLLEEIQEKQKEFDRLIDTYRQKTYSCANINCEWYSQNAYLNCRRVDLVTECKEYIDVK